MADNTLTGTIFKATGGFYYVRPDSGGPELECRARGIFRKDGIKPLVGDRVLATPLENGTGAVDEILPRKNELSRPPLANLDYMVAVLSVTDPVPNLVTVDKFLAVLDYKDIEPIIVITKSDLVPPDSLAELYRNAGFEVFITDIVTRVGIAELTARLAGGFGAFSGNSGVGKSSLLNTIDPGFAAATGETSKKLGRGRHTTRHIETFELPGGGLVADTPGFTSLELALMSGITRDELAGCYRDFAEHTGGCMFQDCTHLCEKGCAVLAAVSGGKIAPSRHASYRQLYDEIKDIKEWQLRR